MIIIVVIKSLEIKFQRVKTEMARVVKSIRPETLDSNLRIKAQWVEALD